MATERWNSGTTIKFLQQIRSHKCLWNQKYLSYNKRAKEAAFQKVVEEMNICGFTVSDAKRKMRNLRSTFYQEKKKIENSFRSCCDNDTVYIPNIPWYKEMDSFLRNVDENEVTEENVCNNFLNETQEEEDNINDYNSDVDNIGKVSECISIQCSTPAIRNGLTRKGIFQTAAELKKQRIEKKELNEEKEDRFDIFGKSVAMQLRSLSFERGMTGQARIQNLLTELSIEDYREKIAPPAETLTSECSTSASFDIKICSST